MIFSVKIREFGIRKCMDVIHHVPPFTSSVYCRDVSLIYNFPHWFNLKQFLDSF